MMRFTVSALLVITTLLGGCDSKSGQPASQFDAIVQVETVSVTATSDKYATVRYKVTNKSNEQITRARAVVTVIDAAGVELASRPGHWVVKAASPLEAEASLENEVPVSVTDPSKVTGALITVNLVRYASGEKVEVDPAAGK